VRRTVGVAAVAAVVTLVFIVEVRSPEREATGVAALREVF
jgi:hypothetical protein